MILYSYETLRLYSDNKDGDYLPIIFIYNLKEKKEVGRLTIKNVNNFKWIDISSNNEIIIQGDKITKFNPEKFQNSK